MTDGLFDKLLDVLLRSDKIGFGLVFAAAGIFAGRYFWPNEFSLLSNDTLGWILFAGLLGAGLLLWNVAILVGGFFRYLLRQTSRVKYEWSAPKRVSNLLPDEMAALFWILKNLDKRIYGDRFDRPFEGLLRKGILRRTDGAARRQVFTLNPRLRKQADAIIAPNKAIADQMQGAPPPWDNGRMRI
jgi:hypothetical protein